MIFFLFKKRQKTFLHGGYENKFFSGSSDTSASQKEISFTIHTYLSLGCRVLNIKDQLLYFRFKRIYKEKIRLEFSI